MSLECIPHNSLSSCCCCHMSTILYCSCDIELMVDMELRVDGDISVDMSEDAIKHRLAKMGRCGNVMIAGSAALQEAPA